MNNETPTPSELDAMASEFSELAEFLRGLDEAIASDLIAAARKIDALVSKMAVAS